MSAPTLKPTESNPGQTRGGELRSAVLSMKGAVDLASIMVGVLVIGIIAGIIAALVFAVIPWSQDQAAKGQLDAVATAEGVAFALEAEDGTSRYLPYEGLKSRDLLQANDKIKVTTNDTGSCYIAASLSATGTTFYGTTGTKNIVDDVDGPAIFPHCDADIPLFGENPFACSATAGTAPELVSAFKDAEDGAVVCLSADVTATATSLTDNIDVPAGVNMSLDVQGHDLVATSGGYGKAGISVVTGTDLTVLDSVGGGTVVADGGKSTEGNDLDGAYAAPYAYAEPDTNWDGRAFTKYSTVAGPGIGGNAGAITGEYGSGKITLRDVSVTALTDSYEVAAIGGGGYNDMKAGPSEEITILHSTVTAVTGNGIGGGYYGDAADIMIQASVVNAASNNSAAIGGGYTGDSGDITITDGSNVTASGQTGIGTGYVGDVGNITIDDSTVVGTGSNGTGIGAGYGNWDGQGGSVGTITITNSDVTGRTTYGGAGIGGGSYGTTGHITIDKSEIVASGGGNGAGIGSGDTGEAGPITITASTVEARGNQQGAAIGGGGNSSQVSKVGDISITKKSVITAIGGTNGGSAIGGGHREGIDNLVLDDSTVTATTGYGAAIGAGYNGATGNIAITSSTVIANGEYGGIGSGYDANSGTITISDSDIEASGEYSGIGAGYGGDSDTILIERSDIRAETTYGSGSVIGAGYDGVSKNLTIESSTVEAISGESTAIGSGGTSESIVIKDSTVTATAGQGGSDVAAIGSGNQKPSIVIAIEDSTVIATAGNGAGIGGSYGSSAGTIALKNSTVTATGGAGGAGIGSTKYGAVDSITIDGGVTVAQGGENAAGIGGGTGRTARGGNEAKNQTSGNITINSGTVTATGGLEGAGIGGGYLSDSGHIVINGGAVTASTGSSTAEAIGHGGTTESWTEWTYDPETGYSSEELTVVLPLATDVTIKGGTVNGVQH